MRFSYQAHLGLDTVQVYTRDHLQGDGVLTRLHVVHLGNEEKHTADIKTELITFTSDSCIKRTRSFSTLEKIV